MSVDGFRGAVACSVGVEVVVECVLPLAQGPPQASDFGDGQAGRRSMRRAARRWPWVGVAWWKNSRTCPVKVGDVDTDVRFICREGLTEAFFLSLEGIHRRDLDTGAKLFAALF